ncbi:MAG: DUF547 domain-containing protein [Myxococcota bacterium]
MAVFEPQPDGRLNSIDYSGIDRILENLVFVSGPSLRRRADRPVPAANTRIVFGHTSPVRLEGNKVKFSRMTQAQRRAIAINIEDLVSFSNAEPINRMPRSAQLAYWINLHNMLVISEISKQYPIRRPRSLEIGPQALPFHEAPIVEIDGVALSLRDIRLGIVYKYWQDPRVMYGFFHGDLASPGIRQHAYKPETIWRDLEKNGRKFVNSLRGVQRRRQERITRVSPLYKEARPALFPAWPNDLTDHLNALAGPEVQKILSSAPSIAFEDYESRIADLVGGEPTMSGSMILSIATSGQFLIAGSPFFRMMEEYVLKNRRLAARFRVGQITIEDLENDKETINTDR